MSRGLIALAATTALLGVSACGDPAPLDGIPEAQRSQLDAAWSARISATDTAAIPLDQRNARVTALYKACEGLDRSTPLLGAVGNVCQPTAISAKLSAVLPERCAKPSAPCVRALDRIADTTEELAAAASALAQAAETSIADPSCRAEFAATTPQLAAYDDLAKAYRVLALGIEQDDEDIAGLGQRRIDDARAQIGPTGRVDERTRRFREACGLAS